MIDGLAGGGTSARVHLRETLVDGHLLGMCVGFVYHLAVESLRENAKACSDKACQAEGQRPETVNGVDNFTERES